MAENNLRFAWLDNCETADSLADFFVRNVSPGYISHGEILTGRAIDEKTWSPDLHEILHKEIRRCAISFRKGENSRVATAVKADKLCALAVVEIVHGTRTLCAWIDDIVVARDEREMGVGGEFLQWIESELGKERVRHVFLESGITNKRAHVFFERKGYSVCSQVMRKAL